MGVMHDGQERCQPAERASSSIRSRVLDAVTRAGLFLGGELAAHQRYAEVVPAVGHLNDTHLRDYSSHFPIDFDLYQQP